MGLSFLVQSYYLDHLKVSCLVKIIESTIILHYYPDILKVQREFSPKSTNLKHNLEIIYFGALESNTFE